MRHEPIARKILSISINPMDKEDSAYILSCGHWVYKSSVDIDNNQEYCECKYCTRSLVGTVGTIRHARRRNPFREIDMTNPPKGNNSLSEYMDTMINLMTKFRDEQVNERKG